MKKQKKDRLIEAGWKVGDAKEFLGLSDEEAALIEVRLALAKLLTEARKRRHATQEQVAKLVGSSQSRVAKMEAADGSVSVDLLLRAVFAMGVSFGDLGDAFAELKPIKPGRRPGAKRATRPLARRR